VNEMDIININVVDTTQLEVGDVISELLVTDTLMWQVIKTTKHTVTVALMSDTGNYWTYDTGNPYPIVYNEVVLKDVSSGTTRLLRRHKDGLFWISKWRVAHKTQRIQNPLTQMVYARRTDYSF
jgi:hypothetical protein